MKTLFDIHLCPREFGSAVFNVPDLLKWAKGKGFHLATVPPLDDYDYAQAECVLSLIANSPLPNSTADEAAHEAAAKEAAAYVATNPKLAQHPAAGCAPGWLAGAYAGEQWRAVFSKAIANGELVLLDRYSRLPMAIAAAPAKTEAVAVTSPSGDWTEKARAIADECFDTDTKGGCRDSLARKKGNKIVGGYSFRVMELMQERGIKGARGIIDNPATIMRDALQGDKWWANKSK